MIYRPLIEFADLVKTLLCPSINLTPTPLFNPSSRHFLYTLLHYRMKKLRNNTSILSVKDKSLGSCCLQGRSTRVPTDHLELFDPV